MKPGIQYSLGCVAAAAATIAIVATVAAWQVRAAGALVNANVLATAQSIQARISLQRERELELKARLLAGDAAFVSYIDNALTVGSEAGATIDQASIRDLVEERRATYGLEDAVILDPLGHSVVASGADYLDPRDIANAPVVAIVRSKLRPTCGWSSYTNKLLLVCVAPLLRGATMQAMLLTATPAGAIFAKELADAGHVDVALIAFPPGGPQVAASTLEPQMAERMLAQITQDPALLNGVRKNRGAASRAVDFFLGSAHWPARLMLLSGVADDAVLVSLLAPSAQAATFNAIVVPAVAGGILLLALLLVGAFIEWRRVRQPLTHLIELVERAVQGNSHVELRSVGNGPAARLASAFNRLLAKENPNRPSKGEPRSAR